MYQELLSWPMHSMLRQLLIACLVTDKLLNKAFLIMSIHVFSQLTATTDDSEQFMCLASSQLLQMTANTKFKVALIAFKAARLFSPKGLYVGTYFNNGQYICNVSIS